MLAEQHDEWLVGHQYMSRGSLRQLLPAEDAPPPRTTNELSANETNERSDHTRAA